MTCAAVAGGTTCGVCTGVCVSTPLVLLTLFFAAVRKSANPELSIKPFVFTAVGILAVCVVACAVLGCIGGASQNQITIRHIDR